MTDLRIQLEMWKFKLRILWNCNGFFWLFQQTNVLMIPFTFYTKTKQIKSERENSHLLILTINKFDI